MTVLDHPSTGEAFDRQREVERLNQKLTDHRFAMEAIALALATIERFDPGRHRLTGKLASYHELFRTVAFDEYRRCPNVRAAATLLDILISERYS
jgi:hypothetical protein